MCGLSKNEFESLFFWGGDGSFWGLYEELCDVKPWLIPSILSFISYFRSSSFVLKMSHEHVADPKLKLNDRFFTKDIWIF